jgi:hypothetical protein
MVSIVPRTRPAYAGGVPSRGGADAACRPHAARAGRELGRVRADAYDNAVAESFFATLKKELVHRQSWPTRRELSGEVFEYIEAFYNRTRRHSTLGYLSPADYENTTLINPGASLAASRLAYPDQESSRTPKAQPCPSGTGELHAVMEDFPLTVTAEAPSGISPVRTADLDDSSHEEMSMCGYTFHGDVKRRTLGRGDMIGMRTKYP